MMNVNVVYVEKCVMFDEVVILIIFGSYFFMGMFVVEFLVLLNVLVK